MSGLVRTRGPGQLEGHVPVMAGEVVQYLNPLPHGRYLDGTTGLGGHSRAIMEKTGGQAELVCLDRDAESLEAAAEALRPYQSRVKFAHERFSNFRAVLDDLGWDKLDGALLDLGVSSPQLDQAGRGFSFLLDGPLDMRMNAQDGEMTAAAWLKRATFDEIKEVIRDFGEEPLAGRIARAIVTARGKAAISTTRELAGIVAGAYPAKMRATARNHPATRTFQAIRLKINDELGELTTFLDSVADSLNSGARVVIISFHSLEDRLVKTRFREMARECVCPAHEPVCVCGHKPLLKVLTKKPVMAGPEEIEANSRARSAKLRAAERLG